MSRGRPYLSRTPSPYEEDEEEDDDNDYGIVKEKADEAMEDATPPGADVYARVCSFRQCWASK
jgi:hypothetical protein